MWKSFYTKIQSFFKNYPLMALCWGMVSLCALYLMTLPFEEFFTRFGIGDALVYARVAFNIAAGKGSTYNLIVPTNGYHPLWMCLHIPFMFGAQTILSRMWLVESFWIITALCATFAWSALIRDLTKSDLAAGLTAILFGTFGWSLYVLYSGIETPLVFLLLAWFFFLANRLRQTRSKSIGGLLALYAVATALTFLARLDSIMLIIPAFWIIYPALSRANRVERSIAIGIFCGLTLPYFIWNLTVIGKLMPVSGIVKTASTIDFSRSQAMILGWMLRINKLGLSSPVLYLAAIGIACGILGIYWSLRDENSVLARLLAVISMGSFIQYVYYLCFMKEINVPWHMYPQFLTAYLFAISLLVVLEKKCSRMIKDLRLYRLSCFGIFGCLIMGSIFMTVQYHRTKQVRRPEVAVAFDLGKWIRTNLPENANIAMHDSFVPAIVASHQAFVDLNGLVENLEGALLIRQRKQTDLIKLRQCEFVVGSEIDSLNSLSSVHLEALTTLAVFSGETTVYPFHYKIMRIGTD